MKIAEKVLFNIASEASYFFHQKDIFVLTWKNLESIFEFITDKIDAGEKIKFVIQGNTQKSLKILLFSQAMCEHVEPLAA